MDEKRVLAELEQIRQDLAQIKSDVAHLVGILSTEEPTVEEPDVTKGAHCGQAGHACGGAHGPKACQDR